MEELPANASEAPTDKIYATGDSVVYYRKDGDTLEAATPDYEGYTKELVQKILGEPEDVLSDPKYLVETFSEKERENLVKLYQEGHLTDEQLRAFWAGAIDIAQASRFGQTYTVYIYKQGQVQLVFKEDNLIYITPDPEVLYFN